MQIMLTGNNQFDLNLLEKKLSKLGHQVSTAGSMAQVAAAMDQEPHIDLIIGQRQAMAGGIEQLVKKYKASRPDRYVYIMVAGAIGSSPADRLTELESIDVAVAAPFNLEALISHIQTGIRIIRLENELNQKFLAIEKIHSQTIQSFLGLIDIYNEPLGLHCRRVGLLARKLAQLHPNVPQAEYPVIEAAGQLHDIGFIGLPRELFSKDRTEMTGDEIQTFRSHPQRGEYLLSQVDWLIPVAQIVRQHHEQYNGRGFPDGLTNEKNLLAAQLVNAASLYDHLVRIKKTPHSRMVENLQLLRGYQLAPEIVQLLIELHIKEMEDEASHDDKSVSLEDLESGMVLSRNILMKSGAACMASGSMLDQNAIEKLKHYLQLGNINDEVFIGK